MWAGYEEALVRYGLVVRWDPEHYRRHFPGASGDLPYVWPPSDRIRRVPV